MPHYDADIKMNIQYEIHNKNLIWHMKSGKDKTNVNIITQHTTPHHATPLHLLTPHEASHAE